MGGLNTLRHEGKKNAAPARYIAENTLRHDKRKTMHGMTGKLMEKKCQTLTGRLTEGLDGPDPVVGHHLSYLMRRATGEMR
jgi:hypothetical protein